MRFVNDCARLRATASASVIVLSGLVHPALAQDTRAEIEALRKHMEDLQRAYQSQMDALNERIGQLDREAAERAEDAALQRQAQEAIEKADTAARTAQKVEEQAPDIMVKWAPGPTLSSKDGSWSVHVLGRLQVDGGGLGDDDGFYKNDNATELRAARLGIEGDFYEGWSYKFETDFGLGDVDVKDAYIEYDGELVDPAYVRVGQYKTPNSLEWLTSRLFITFMERSAIVDAFGLDRQIGLGSGVSAVRTGASTPACSGRTPATRRTMRATRSPAAIITPSSTVPKTVATRCTWAPRPAIATSRTTPSTARSSTNSGHSSTSPARAASIPGRSTTPKATSGPGPSSPGSTARSHCRARSRTPRCSARTGRTMPTTSGAAISAPATS